MATSIDFIEYVCEQLIGMKEIRYRKMFGEYMIYIEDRPILLVCDNTVFIKKIAQIEELMYKADTGIPYKGAKEHYILDIDNRDLNQEVITILLKVIPIPKSRKKRSSI